MKWTIHKPDDCELGKQQARQGNQQQQQQANKQQNTANQATYANLLAQLALQAAEAAEAAEEWWCTLAWLNLGFLAMAKPTISSQIQAILILTLFCMFCSLFCHPWHFYHYLELHSVCHSHHIRCHHSHRLPVMRSKQAGKKKRFREKMKRKKRKFPSSLTC